MGRATEEIAMSNYEKHMLSCFGFRDGAGGRPINEARNKFQEYEQAYIEGQKVKREHFAKYAKELGVTEREIKMSVLK